MRATRRLRWLHVAMILAVGWSFGVVPPAVGATPPTLLAIVPGALLEGPRTDGAFVVWSAPEAGSETGRVFVHDLQTGTTMPASIEAGDQRAPDVQGGVLIWSQAVGTCPGCAYQLRGKNLYNGAEFVIDTAGNDRLPVVGFGRVVWVSEQSDGRQQILVQLPGSSAAPSVVAEVAGGTVVQQPRFDRNRLLWNEMTGTGAAQRQRLRTATIEETTAGDFRAGTIETVVEVEGTGVIHSYDLSSDIVVYSLSTSVNSLFARDLRTGETTFLQDTVYQSTIMQGRFVFFGADTVGGYDLQTDSAYDVSGGPPTFVRSLSSGEDYLVWHTGQADGIARIFGLRLREALPIGRIPAPEITFPERRVYPETGHSISYGFKLYWDRNGGLPVFGYPVTEEYSERNPDTGQRYTVQYFERQRFEYHPENAGTPYEVLLGRLGVANAAQRGLLGSIPFRPLPERASIGADCTLFVETRHQVCGRFRDYWQRYGLEFGDPGVSARESLALWGYPISEAYTDPDTGQQIQYFERALFEYHPEYSGTPFEVLIARLGETQLSNQGW